MTRSKPKPIAVPAMEGDQRIVALSAKLLEHDEDLLQVHAELEEIKRHLKLEVQRPPAGWINLKEVASRYNVSVECARLWCVRNIVRANRFKSRWYVDPNSFGQLELND